MVNLGVQGHAEYPRHIPVLLHDFINQLKPFSGVWVDGTFGDGGYSEILLKSEAKTVIAIDRDPSVIASASKLSKRFPTRFSFANERFSKLADIVKSLGFKSVDGVLLDLGVSSMQIDQANRGFSFQKKGPLDMRMSCTGLSAFDVVNSFSEKDLANIIYTFGEERFSRRIAKNIVQERKNKEIDSTETLTRLISNCFPKKNSFKTHPATRTFQALRIFVNNELEELVEGLEAAERILAPNGILAVITFHSLEDRIVKRFIKLKSGAYPKGNRHQPMQSKWKQSFEKFVKKEITASDAEVKLNSRARSAKLRIAKKLMSEFSPIEKTLLGLPIINLEAQKR